MKFSIWIVQPKNWVHMRMFVPIATALNQALRDLGHETSFAPGDAPLLVGPPDTSGRPIIIGAHFLPDIPLPDNTIIYNFEQVPGDFGTGPYETNSEVANQWLCSDFLKVFKRHEVWDFSIKNVERLRRFGVSRIKHVPIYYSPAMTMIESLPTAEQDIDVFFYGTMSERRIKILNSLEKARVEENGVERPLQLGVVSGVYGAELDALIARSRVVLNMHANWPHLAPAVFEQVRCSHLVANKKCVVSESGGHDPDLDLFASRITVQAPYDDLVRTCTLLAGDNAARERRAKQGFDIFKTHSYTKSIAAALKS